MLCAFTSVPSLDRENFHYGMNRLDSTACPVVRARARWSRGPCSRCLPRLARLILFYLGARRAPTV